MSYLNKIKLGNITFRAFEGCEMTYRLELNQADHKQHLSDFIQVFPFLYLKILYTPVAHPKTLPMFHFNFWEDFLLLTCTKLPQDFHIKYYSAAPALHTAYAFTPCPCLDVHILVCLFCLHCPGVVTINKLPCSWQVQEDLGKWTSALPHQCLIQSVCRQSLKMMEQHLHW